MLRTRRLVKEIYQVINTVESLSNGQAKISQLDNENVRTIHVTIRPTDGLYEGGIFEFKVTFPENYPDVHPHVICLTDIYHPNIGAPGQERNVCLSMLQHESQWNSYMGLEDCIQGLLFLLYNPNLDDPLTVLADDIDENTFEANARKYTREGYKFRNPTFLINDGSMSSYNGSFTSISARNEFVRNARRRNKIANWYRKRRQWFRNVWSRMRRHRKQKSST